MIPNRKNHKAIFSFRATAFKYLTTVSLNGSVLPARRLSSTALFSSFFFPMTTSGRLLSSIENHNEARQQTSERMNVSQHANTAYRQPTGVSGVMTDCEKVMVNTKVAPAKEINCFCRISSCVPLRLEQRSDPLASFDNAVYGLVNRGL
jgi:hypothetical protein